MRAAGLPTLQIVACLAIAAAGLVPVFHKNKSFWGLYGISFDAGPAKVHQVEDNSPASSAGLQVDDIILAVEGSPVDNESLTTILESLQPGEAARLRVEREGMELDVTAKGVEPPVAMVYYPTPLHPIAGGLAVVVGLIVLGTQPIRPAPRWRMVVVCVVGIACATAFFLAITSDGDLPRWIVRRYHNLNWGTRLHFEQSWVGLLASLTLAMLAAWELRGSFVKGPPLQDSSR